MCSAVSLKFFFQSHACRFCLYIIYVDHRFVYSHVSGIEGLYVICMSSCLSYPMLLYSLHYTHIANQLFADKLGIFLYTITTNHHQTVFSWLHYSLVVWLLSKFPQLLRSLIRFEHPYIQSPFSCIYARNIISCYWYGQIHVDWK